MKRREPLPLPIIDHLATLDGPATRLSHLLTLEVWPRSRAELEAALGGDREKLGALLDEACAHGALYLISRSGLAAWVYARPGDDASDAVLAPYLSVREQFLRRRNEFTYPVSVQDLKTALGVENVDRLTRTLTQAGVLVQVGPGSYDLTRQGGGRARGASRKERA